VQQDSSITLSGSDLTLVGVTLVSGDELEVQGIVNVGAMDNIPMDGSVTEGKIGGNAVTAAKIASGAVTSAKIGADAVGASAIATGAVGASEIAANSVTVAQMSRAGTSGHVLTSAGTGADAAWAAAAGGGKILQVLQAVKTDSETTTSAGFVDVTDLSIAITPAATSSKILVFANILLVGTVGSAGAFSQIVRDSTPIGIGDTAGSRIRAMAFGYAPDAGDTRHHSTVWLDSPSTTSATTYKVQFTANGTNTAYVNRTQADTDSNAYARGVSTITVMEIGA
jgi:hypothetical protein